MTTKLELTSGYGTRFHAGLCVVFGNDDVFIFAPRGSTEATSHVLAGRFARGPACRTEVFEMPSEPPKPLWRVR